MTAYYVQISSSTPSAIETHPWEEAYWRVDNTMAERIDTMPSELTIHNAESSEEMIDTLQKRFPGTRFYKLELAPGEYFPRMARPVSAHPEAGPDYSPDRSAVARNARTESTGQLHALIDELEQICRVVHPIDANFAAFGHAIRNIIILASTEVEAHWKNILKANGEKARSTKDYVKLTAPMKLGQYGVVLSYYPWIEPIFPFKGWVPNTPTKTLKWYESYNNIKHDRQTNFAEATLLSALKAVTGCYVMLCAQYGRRYLEEDGGSSAFFQIIRVPHWEPSEIYVLPFGSQLKERHFPFQNSN
jgi:hypothetical protein